MSEMELYESTWKLASRVHQTPFVPRAMQGKPEHVLACVLYGNELGLGPMQSLNSIHIIEGRAAASPELMRALVAKAGHRIDVTENTNTACTMKGSRADTGAEATVRWTLEDAKNANLSGKDNWKKYPRAMLAARATSELCRLLFPDVIAGLSYTPEEVESIGDAGIVTPPRRQAEESPAPIVDDIVDAVIVEADAVPHAESSEPELVVGADSGSDPITLVFEAFPGTTVIEDDEVVTAEIVDNSSVEERRKRMKTWGVWNRVRAIAMPIARGEGIAPPQNIDEFVNNARLFELVAAQLERK
jgi:RecT family